MKAMALARLGRGHRHEARLHGVSYAAGVLVCFAALGGAAGGVARRRPDGRLGVPVPVPRLCRGDDVGAAGGRAEPVRRVRGRRRAGVAGAGGRLVARRRSRRQLLHRPARRAGRDALHGAVHGGAVAAALASPPAATLAGVPGPGRWASPLRMRAGRGCRAWPGSLPRPGRWMDVLRQALAFPMYAAAAWLLWVVSQQAGPDGVLATAGGAGAGRASPPGPCGWPARFPARAAGRARPRRGCRWSRWRRCWAAAGGGEAGGAATPGDGRGRRGASRSPRERLAALRAEGRPVFVNMTAAWCVTCLVNERVALARDAGPARLRRTRRRLPEGRLDPAATRPSPRSCARGAGTGCRYTFISPEPGRAPAILPQILTPDDVLTAIAAG